MKTAIVYTSTHHGNTKKLVDAIAAKFDVALIDAVSQKDAELGGFDLVGYASGVAFGKYYPQILTFMEKNAPKDKKVFFMHTAGDPRESHNAAAKAITDARGCETAGTFFCKGFDTFGPFRLVGGIAKGHPTEDEISAAVRFYEGIVKE